MALKEQDIVFTDKDANGNTIIQMPITRAGNVEDLTTTCLLLAGGTMKGTVKTSNSTSMMQATDDSYVGIYGGTAYNKGAYGVFYGINNADNPGSAAIQTYDSSGNSKRLILKPDGTATWGGKNIVCSVNGTTAGTDGNVTLTKQDIVDSLGYTPPTTNTTYSAATQSAQGLMSAADKKKLDGINANVSTKAYVTESSNGSTSWYVKWSNGFIMQGGYVTGNGTKTITFPKAFSKAPLSVVGHIEGVSDRNNAYQEFPHTVTATNFKQYIWNNFPIRWFAAGF